ncbi:sulfotransferase domain-containing protein [Jannaschia sp. KMU-145]|uniref:sulfotransferase domain-containing protein n=1 Tax=Jannaschia halovivens TaxID=3388667 RepID=UPI00396B1479
MTSDPHLKRPRMRGWHFANAALRQIVLRGATRPFADNIILNEYPKSGGSWIGQMLAAAVGLPFPRRRLPLMRSCMMQCHVLNPAGLRNVVVVWRDGRDVMVSYYYHLVVGHPGSSPSILRRTRARLGIRDPLDIEANLPRFVERMLTEPLSPRFTWPEFVERWHGRPDVVSTSYEAMLRDTPGELARVVEARTGELPSSALISRVVEEFTFVRQSGRLPGEEDATSFLRKGVVGDWHNHFDAPTTAIFMRHAASALSKLGYDA